MTTEEIIEYWEQFSAEIDDLYNTCSDVEMGILEKQREVVEFTISALRELLQAEHDGRIAVQKAVPGSKVWIMERDEFGDPYDISGYMFFASIGNAVIVSPYLSGIKDLEETLDYYIEITAEEYSSYLAVFPNEDCYLTREEAEAALAKKGCNQ